MLEAMAASMDGNHEKRKYYGIVHTSPFSRTGTSLSYSDTDKQSIKYSAAMIQSVGYLDSLINNLFVKCFH